MRSRTGIHLFLAIGIAAAVGSARTARAGGVDTLIEQAAPAVRTAIEAEPLAARAALSALLGRGTISRDQLVAALGKDIFAPYAVDTLAALAKVDGIEGAAATFERLVKAADDGGVRGSSFEIEAAAALGDRVAAIGPVIEGNEVDLLLHDGTVVEVKNDAPDESLKLSDSLSGKAIKQLGKRGAFGNPVMLIANEPLPPDALASFRRRLGPTSEVVIVSGGRMWTQLARGAESRGQRMRRLAIGKLRRTLHRGKTRAASALRPTAKLLRRLRPKRIVARLRGQARAPQAGR